MKARDVSVYLDDGYVNVSGLPNWDDVLFSRLQVALVDGIPELTSIAISSTTGTPITRERLARVPVRKLAKLAAAFLLGGKRTGFESVDGLTSSSKLIDVHQIFRALGDLGSMVNDLPPRPRGGSLEYSRAIADIVRLAVVQGERPAKKVADAASVTIDRANQLIRVAKDDGALPDQDVRRPAPSATVVPRRPATRRATPPDRRESK